MKYLSCSEFRACFEGFITNKVSELEEIFAEHTSCQYVLATSSARVALYLALRAIDVEKKEVLVPAFACRVIIEAVILAGGIPVFIDVDSRTLNIILSDARTKISKKTVALIFIHYYGKVCSNFSEIRTFAKENHLNIVEDCAHSLGAEYGNAKAGSLGDVSAFSLTKNTLNCGGGIFCTNNKVFYEGAREILRKDSRRIVKKMRDLYGSVIFGYKMVVDRIVFDRVGRSIWKWWLINLPDVFFGSVLKILRSVKEVLKIKDNIDFYNVEEKHIGKVRDIHNLAMHPLFASIGIVQLGKLGGLNSRRIEIGKKLQQLLPEYSLSNWVKGSGEENVCMSFPLWFKTGCLNELVKKCKSEGLLLRKSWPATQGYWKEQKTENIEAIGKSLLLLEVNPMLTNEEIGMIKRIIENALRV